MCKRTSDKSELTDEDLQFIIANTGFERSKVLKWFEDFKSQCPELQLNREEFVDFYKRLIPGESEAEEEFCSHVFDAFDADNNGYVDFGEFLVAFWIRAKGSLKEKLAWLFDIYDTDNSNYITHDELTNMLKLIFSIKSINEDPFSKAFYIMKDSDRNNTGKVTKYEFIAACTNDEELRELLAPY